MRTSGRHSSRGAVVIGGHFGNWEVGAAMMAARGFPISKVPQRQANPLFNRHLVEARRRLGIEVIERGGRQHRRWKTRPSQEPGTR